ncbi:lysophospholipid acyltransferase family protein [Granulicoccus sp. GXG6511]|uniref:lysophospholipid acyltransferase family protein n=1 Tax=Granulicoccus sp. GXG6511 TaxID=3381351 RepID=UPI003D7C8C9F
MSERGRYRSKSHRAARFVAQQLLLKPTVWALVDVTVHGKERLRHLEDPYIVVANHSSHLDSPLIIGALPRRLSRQLATGAAADYWYGKFWKSASTGLFFNTFPVERGRGLRGRGSKARGLAGHLLNDGVPLLIFPEGTRSRTGAMGSFKPGTAALCISRNVPCLPIALVGASLAMPTGKTLPVKGRPKVHVVFGEPMWATPGESAHEFSDRIAARIRELHDEVAAQSELPLMSDYEQAAIAAKAADQTAPANPAEPTDDEPTQQSDEEKGPQQ